MREDQCRCARVLRQSLIAPAQQGPSSRLVRASLSHHTDGPWRRAWAVVWLVVAACGVASAVHAAPPSNGKKATLKIAATLALSGATKSYGQPALEGAQLAVEEANATGAGPAIELIAYDDGGIAAGGQEAARQITASDALVVVGPSATVVALEAGSIYADAGLACVATSAAGDTVTAHATIFQASYNTSDLGEGLAHYLRYALRGTRAAVIVKEDEWYGQGVAAGFRRAAERLGITTTYHPFITTAEAETAAQRVAADPEHPAVILASLVNDAVPAAVVTLRRQRAQGPILGATAIAGEFFLDLFKDQPEERQQPGFFTDGVYANLPLLFDSANAETLALAKRYRARFHREPTFFVAQGYEAARIAVAAVRATAARTMATTDLRARREAIRTYLSALDRPERGVDGLNGPLWFTPERGRQQPLRVGRFHGAAFESAPLQLTPVPTPDPAELDSGVVFEVEAGRYARLQRVVYTGVFINEISRLDLTRSSFNADLYLWLRFARDAGQSTDDPTDINFPTLLSGTFDRTRPAAQRTLPDGTEYRLWRVQGEFRNDFDLRRFPFDTQTLTLSFGNARADMDRIVYVLDQRASMGARQGAPPPPSGPGSAMAAAPGPGAPADERLSIASATTFRNLTQWDPLSASSRRENLVTESALGDPTRIGVQSSRELSGFLVTVALHRRTLATLTKTLLPLLLLTLIMYASLHFPKQMASSKASIAITGALSAAVLLAAINSQLGGNIGYTLAVEYAFYVFFGLSFLCILSVLSTECLRATDRGDLATRAERWTRIVFLMAVSVMVVGAIGLARSP